MIGLQYPLFALVAFAVFYQPVFTRYLPSDPWLRLAVSPQAFFFVSVLVIAAARRLRLRDIGIEKEKLLHRFSLGMVMGLSPVVAVFIAGIALTWIDNSRPFLPYPVFGGAPLGIPITAPYLLTLLVLAPLSEELFFRGILLRALREHYSSAVSILLSAVIFMGGHGHIAIGPLVLGLINAFVTVRTGSILSGIVFHVIANAYGPAMIAWFPNLYRYFHFLYE